MIGRERQPIHRGWLTPLLWIVALAAATGFAFLLLANIAASQRAVVARDAATSRQMHTYEVMLTAERLRSSLFDTQRGMRGFLIARDERFLGPFRVALDRLTPLGAQLRTLTRDNPVQQTRLDRLDALTALQRSRMLANIADVQAGRISAVLAQVRSGAGEISINAVRALIDEIVAEEQRLLGVRTATLAAASVDAEAAARALSVLGLTLLGIAILAGGISVRAAFQARRAGDAALSAARARDVLEIAVARRTAEIVESNKRLTDEVARKEAAEQQVRQMQKLESIGQLTGGIAHDFNNMLAIVIGSLDLAQRRLDDPTGRVLTYIDNAMDGAKRAAALTAKLLTFSRQQALAPEPIDANTFVKAISELLRRTLGEGVEIETVLAGGLWRTYADAGELENAIVNLAVNARDAMDGRGKLTIETSNTHLDDAYAATHGDVIAGQYVVVCVTDTGGGMPDTVIAKAFDPFFTTKGVGKGTGLGLSQVYGFVKQSGGHVKIYSETGHGTTVKLYLPRWTGADAAVAQPATLAPLPRARAGETILVVEDESAVRLVTVEALRELGYLVVHAGDGAEALTQLGSEQRFDLLFTDIVMPNMTGRELADRAKAQRPDLPVLYTTGYTRNAVVHNGMLDADVAFLPKPFSIEALAVKVRLVLEGGGVNRTV